jgi:hypothetical protein
VRTCLSTVSQPRTPFMPFWSTLRMLPLPSLVILPSSAPRAWIESVCGRGKASSKITCALLSGGFCGNASAFRGANTRAAAANSEVASVCSDCCCCSPLCALCCVTEDLTFDDCMQPGAKPLITCNRLKHVMSCRLQPFMVSSTAVVTKKSN